MTWPLPETATADEIRAAQKMLRQNLGQFEVLADGAEGEVVAARSRLKTAELDYELAADNYERTAYKIRVLQERINEIGG